MATPHLRSGADDLVDVAGLAVRIEAESAGDLDLVTRVVGRRATHGEPAVKLSIGHRAPPLPQFPPDLEGPYGDHWFQGTPKYFHHHWGMDVEITDRSVLMGGPARDHRRWVSVRNAMLFVLAHLYLSRDRFLVHGAAIRRAKECYLVLGSSGAGKSTLAFAAADAGWDLLGDDMVVVDRTPEGFMARGVPRVPSVPGDVAGASNAHLPRLPDDDRERVELDQLDLCEASAQISGVVLCGHHPGAGDLAAVSMPHALEALASSFVLSEYPAGLKEWFGCAAGLSRLPVIRVLHSNEPDDRLARAVELLGLWEKDRSLAHRVEVRT